MHSNLEEAKNYLKKKLDNKSIYLLGGGKSANDLLKSNDIHPKQVLNIDPFISEEDIDRNNKGVYRSISQRADSDSLIEEINSNKLELADEIWASFSVPFYNQSKEEIDNLFNNIKNLLKESGNCRITPLSTQNKEASEAVLNNLKDITSSKDYNIHLQGETLVIHKLSQEN
ncbi:MAG: hypothetical protein K9M44_04925 [Candidatus Pacebacteria bacterium]|nr:hypothetical protein [Candidatus Paceibacterota bacterium]